MPNHIFCENDKLLLKSRLLQIKGGEIVANLSKHQTILVHCLMNKINEKELIMECVWPGKIKDSKKTKENRYNYLIFKTRLNLSENGFPSDFILTIKGYGICLNSDFLLRKVNHLDVCCSGRVFNN